eukprot:6755125-Prymnesium_polylepis.1
MKVNVRSCEVWRVLLARVACVLASVRLYRPYSMLELRSAVCRNALLSLRVLSPPGGARRRPVVFQLAQANSTASYSTNKRPRTVVTTNKNNYSSNLETAVI